MIKSFISLGFILLTLSCNTTKKSQAELEKSAQRVQTYLAENSVYLSLTTSPKRIKYIPKVLETIDTRLIKEILLAIPEVFSRTGEKYIIPPELLTYPKLKVLRIPHDLGPITKLIPAIRYVRDEKKEPNSIVITIDDDIGYGDDTDSKEAYGFIFSIIDEVVQNPNTIIAGKRMPFGFFGINSDHWPETPEKDYYLAEGFASIAYKAKYVNDAFMMKIIEQEKELMPNTFCNISDDLVINYALAKNNIKQKSLWNGDFSSYLTVFDYGKEEDALHRGAGMKKPSGNPNYKKYKKCYNYIINHY